MNIFQNNMRSIPKKSETIVRVPMTENEIGGRKDHMPKAEENPGTIRHVNKG